MLSVWKHFSLCIPLLLGEGKDFVQAALGGGWVFFNFSKCCLFAFAKAMYPVSSHCAYSCPQLFAPELGFVSLPSHSTGQDRLGARSSGTVLPDAVACTESCCLPKAVRMSTGKSCHLKKRQKSACEQLLIACRQLWASPSFEATFGNDSKQGAQALCNVLHVCIYLCILANDTVRVYSQFQVSGKGEKVGAGSQRGREQRLIGTVLLCAWNGTAGYCVCAVRAGGGGEYMELCRIALQGRGNAESKQC